MSRSPLDKTNLTSAIAHVQRRASAGLAAFLIIPNGLGKSSERMKTILENKSHVLRSLVVVLRTVAHPVNQGIKHEAITEQANRE